MKISKEVKVGLFMVSAIILLYVGFEFLKGVDFFSTNKKYYAIYRNVDKLTKSNEIYLNGYGIGRVSNIQIQQNKDRVVVELSIDSEITITRSSIAVLNGELLGGRFIQIIVGKPDEALKPKDTIQTDVAKGLTELITENAKPVAANLQTTLSKLNNILDTLGTSAMLLNQMLTDLHTTPRLLNNTISSVKGNVGELSGTFQSVGTNLNNTLTDLKPTLQNFKTLSDSLKMIQLNGTVTKAQQAISKLNETLSKLNKGDNTASKLMTEDSLYVNLNSLLNNLDSLANHFNENPRHFMAPLGKSRKKIERELKEQNEKNAVKNKQ
jgi:phospholipid/cholesterol/gamma-HCH transport system substrate-binding protein